MRTTIAGLLGLFVWLVGGYAVATSMSQRAEAYRPCNECAPACECVCPKGAEDGHR
jgi:hypothetical protein